MGDFGFSLIPFLSQLLPVHYAPYSTKSTAALILMHLGAPETTDLFAAIKLGFFCLQTDRL